MDNDTGNQSWNLPKRALYLLIAPLAAIAFVIQDASPSLFFYDMLTPRHNRLHPFHEQTVWVTGASSGIGLEILCHLMEANTKHVIISARRYEALEKAIQLCKSRSPLESSTKLSIIPYDASSSEALEVVDRVLAVAAPFAVDRLVLNAGIYQLQPALETPVEYSRRIMKVNYQSPTEIATSLLQRNQQPVHIIVVASIISRGAFALTSSYAASKHALRAFFHSLAAETTASSGRIDVSCPAGTKTQLWSSISTRSPDPEECDLMEAKRVAWLILTGATGPYWMFWETWIGRPMPLLWTTFASYAPDLFQCMTLLVGWCRMYFYREHGADVSDPWTLMSALWK